MTVSTDSRRLQNRTLLGIGLMLLGLALYPLADAFVKHLLGTYSVPQTTFLRALTRLLPLFIATFLQGGPRHVLMTHHPRAHLLRLGVNLAYTLAFMLAMKMGFLTLVYTISYTSPLFMILLSALLLKESVGRDRWIAVGLGMIGALIAMQPGSHLCEMIALLVLAGTFLGALNKILMRKLAATEHSLAIAIYPNIVMILAMMPFLVHGWESMPWEHWGLFAFVGIVTAAGQYAIAQALRFAQASALAPIDYSSFLWVVLLDYFWWQKTLDLTTFLGATAIVGSNLYILFCTRREARRKQPIVATN
jgi:drug/metabolite transporter (DMT)-like permease